MSEEGAQRNMSGGSGKETREASMLAARLLVDAWDNSQLELVGANAT